MGLIWEAESSYYCADSACSQILTSQIRYGSSPPISIVAPSTMRPLLLRGTSWQPRSKSSCVSSRYLTRE